MILLRQHDNSPGHIQVLAGTEGVGEEADLPAVCAGRSLHHLQHHDVLRAVAL